MHAALAVLLLCFVVSESVAQCSEGPTIELTEFPQAWSGDINNGYWEVTAPVLWTMKNSAGRTVGAMQGSFHQRGIASQDYQGRNYVSDLRETCTNCPTQWIYDERHEGGVTGYQWVVGDSHLHRTFSSPGVLSTHTYTYNFHTTNPSYESLLPQDQLLCLAAVDPKNNGPECGSTNHPIAIGTGNKWLVERDVADALGFSRTYNSNPATPTSVFGEHWMGSHTQRLEFDESGGIRAIRADGKVYRYTAAGSSYAADADVVERLSAEIGSGGTPVGYRLETADHGVERYDAAGRLNSVTSASGQVLTMAYDGDNRLSSVSDAFGRSLALTYDADGRVATLTGPGGGITRYTYDVIGNLTGVTYPDGKSRAYQYDHPPFRSHLTGITDEHGVQFATYYYDDQGRATSESLAGGVDEASLSYDADSTTVADALGNSRTYHFNTVQGRVKSTGQSQPDGAGCSAAASARSYDANGNATSQTDFNGVTTTYQYDPTRNLETQRVEASGLPEARTISTQWHGYWRAPVRVAEPLKITTYVYNGDGGVYCAPAGAKIPGRNGGTHPIKVLCSRTEQATTDADGTQAFGAAPTGAPRTWKWTYNAYGQVLTTDGPRTDVADTTTVTYHPASDPVVANRGRVATVTNALGHVTQYGAYDLNGNPLSIIDPNGEITTLAYDARQRLTRRTQGSRTTLYSYDAAGQLKQVNLPDGGTLTYTYDAAHRLTRISDGLGNHVSYELDGAGNRIAETIKDSNQALFQNIMRTFDALSRVQSEQR